MSCWRHGGGSRWRNEYGERMQRMGGRWWAHGPRGSSGNHAFDEYRSDTLRRLEEEQKEFLDFLERLRHAKDKAEFDQFMSDRGRRPSGPDTQPQPQPQM